MISTWHSDSRRSKDAGFCVNAYTVYRVYEYAVPVTTVATVPSALPTTAGIPGIAAYSPVGGFPGI
jgi:hypothetical protein